MKQVDCDDRYTVVLTEAGEVFHMGMSETGWLMNSYKYTPQEVSLPEKVK